VRAQPRKKLGRHLTVHVGQRDLLGILDDGTFGRREGSGVAFDEGIDLRLRETRGEGAGHVLLVAGEAAVDQRQLEPCELLVTLLHGAAEEHLGIELPHHEFEQLRRLGEDLDEGGVAGEFIEHVASGLPLRGHVVAVDAGEERVKHDEILLLLRDKY
jgi:hypothetical protein